MATVVVLAGLAVAGVAAADGDATRSRSFDVADLRAFAAAAAEVLEIERSFARRIETAATEDERDALRRQGLDQVVAAIEAAGLTSERYNRILLATRTDDMLLQDVAARVDALR